MVSEEIFEMSVLTTSTNVGIQTYFHALEHPEGTNPFQLFDLNCCEETLK